MPKQNITIRFDPDEYKDLQAEFELFKEYAHSEGNMLPLYLTTIFEFGARSFLGMPERQPQDPWLGMLGQRYREGER